MRRTSLFMLATVIVVLGFRPVVRGQADKPAERFVATTINISNVGPVGGGQLQIQVDRWSTDAERDRLAAALKQGEDQLLKALQAMPRIGFMRTPTSVAYDLHFARQAPLDEGGRQIVIATDRRLSFGEIVNRPRSVDYPFTVIQMQINRGGEGEGKMSVATRVTLDKGNVLVLENYADQPVMLTRVRSEGAPAK